MLFNLNHRSFYLVFFCFICVLSSFSQQNYFEGIITYHHHYKSTDANFDADQISEALGTRSEFFFKEGNYLQLYNGKFQKYNLYRKTDQKVYSKFATSDTLFWTNATIKSEVITDSSLAPTDETVLSHPCSVLTVKTATPSGEYYSTRKYYFSKEVPVKQEWLSEHHYNSMSEIYAKTGAIPLKIIIETDQFIMTMTALKIDRQSLELQYFELEKDQALAPLEK